MARCVVIDRKYPTGSGHICFVPARAGWSSVISASDTPVVVRTNLKGDGGEPEDSLRDRMKLMRVNLLLVSIIWENRPLRIQPHI